MSSGLISQKAGVTLLELLITIVIIGLLAASGAQYYQNYIKQTYLSVAQMNAQALRVFMTDYYLQRGTYLARNEQTVYNKADLNTYFGWRPEGDNNQYAYTVNVTAQSWDIVITHLSGHWLRCEQRMQICCDSDTPDASLLSCR